MPVRSVGDVLEDRVNLQLDYLAEPFHEWARRQIDPAYDDWKNNKDMALEFSYQLYVEMKKGVQLPPPGTQNITHFKRPIEECGH